MHACHATAVYDLLALGSRLLAHPMLQLSPARLLQFMLSFLKAKQKDGGASKGVMWCGVVLYGAA